MKTLYIKFKVIGISYFDAPPEETLRLNGFDTGMRCYEATAAVPAGGPCAYAEYEIADATFSMHAVMQPVRYTFSDDDGIQHNVSDDVWVARPVSGSFALPDIRTARAKRELYEAALERLSHEIGPARRIAGADAL